MYGITGNNDYQSNVIDKLVSASNTDALTRTYLRTCSSKSGSCNNCGTQACKACPVKAFYDRKFDMLADMEEAREEARQRAAERHCRTSLGSLIAAVM